MQPKTSQPPNGGPARLTTDTLLPRLAGDETVAVVDGYGIRISVQRGHLLIADGVGRHRRERRFSRATCPAKRILILGHTGAITLEAIRWCSDVGVAIAQLDHDGRLLVTSATRWAGAARIRRVQALAMFTSVGLDVARFVLGRKIRGQLDLVRQLPGVKSIDPVFDGARVDIADAKTIDDLLRLESSVAAAYWMRWASVETVFAETIRTGVPGHWKSFGQRRSTRVSKTRHAITPANAILNYLYRLLEVETTIAIHASGLDPTIGIWHADERYRDSLALDLMEAGRPAVDSYALSLLGTEIFRKCDFIETPEGGCRLAAPLTHQLAAALPAIRNVIEPVVMEAGRLLDHSPTISDTGGLTLTSPRRSEHRRRTAVSHAMPLPRMDRCSACGVSLDGATGAQCRTCRAEKWSRPAGGEPVARVSERRRASLSRQTAATAAWNRTHTERPPASRFAEKIWPHLEAFSVSEISRQTGLSRRYCKLIREGDVVPHPRHWPTFASLTRDQPGG